jgi:cystathionine gamma-synthase
MTKRTLHPRSLAAQAMGKIDPLTKAVVPPIHIATTYIRDEDNAYSSGFVYGRPDNETTREAESVLAMLEEAKAGALLFGSGMAAATAVFQALSPGDHVVASKVMYWALRSWLLTEATRWGLKIDFVETDDLVALKAAVKPGVTKLVWAETPSNPLWTITDIAGAAEIAHAAGARLAVDSTCASPVHTRPLTLGADIVMHAATKVLNGHSDVVAGVLCAREDDEFWGRVKTVRKMQGGILGPFEAYLLMRGLRTLHVRQERQSAGGARALSRPAAASRPRHRLPADGGRLRLHALDPGHRRRGGGGEGRRQCRALQARDVAGRRREPDRAPLLDRGRRLALPDRPAAPLDRHRGCRGPVRRYRPGAEGRARVVQPPPATEQSAGNPLL